MSWFSINCKLSVTPMLKFFWMDTCYLQKQFCNHIQRTVSKTDMSLRLFSKGCVCVEHYMYWFRDWIKPCDHTFIKPSRVKSCDCTFIKPCGVKPCDCTFIEPSRVKQCHRTLIEPSRVKLCDHTFINPSWATPCDHTLIKPSSVN